VRRQDFSRSGSPKVTCRHARTVISEEFTAAHKKRTKYATS
jgi:hypothetical protein